MLTALLWIVLIISIILLIAVASPIRLSCIAAYRENGHDGYDTKFQAAAYYIHPQILRTEYSAADGKFRIFILGFERREKGVDTDGIDTESIDTSAINTDDVDTDATGNSRINTDGINADNIDTNDISTDTDDTDDIDTGKRKSYISRLKSKINAIKQSRIYKIIRNKPLRQKLLRWSKHSVVRAIRAVSLKKLKLHVRIGAQDPVALGKIYGYFAAAKSALLPRRHRNRVDLSMTPVFMERCLDIYSELKIKTTLSTILWHLTVIAATFPYWRARRAVSETAPNPPVLS